MRNETYHEYWDKFDESQKISVPWASCPYPAGPNEISNLMVQDFASFLPPYIPGGEKWKVEVRFVKDGVEAGGYNAYGILRSEQSILDG